MNRQKCFRDFSLSGVSRKEDRLKFQLLGELVLYLIKKGPISGVFPDVDWCRVPFMCFLYSKVNT